MYRQNKYYMFNTEKEIDRLKEEIRRLAMSNKEKISLLKVIEDMKTNNINLKHRLHETAENLSVKDDEIGKLTENYSTNPNYIPG